VTKKVVGVFVRFRAPLQHHLQHLQKDFPSQASNKPASLISVFSISTRFFYSILLGSIGCFVLAGNDFAEIPRRFRRR
jgi:hypothetical protein